VKKARQAKRLWYEALPIFGTVAEIYLREARKITCSLPQTLRFHPECWHGPTAKRYPAMLAIVQGTVSFAVHRTYLLGDGSGKATIRPNKMMLGAVAGGAVRISEGSGALIVAEGIETALSLPMLLRKHGKVRAALSTSGLIKLRLPDRPERLIIAVDGETAGRKAGRALAQRAIDAGWRVRIADPGDGLNFNDLLNKEAVT